MLSTRVAHKDPQNALPKRSLEDRIKLTTFKACKERSGTINTSTLTIPRELFEIPSKQTLTAIN